MTRNAAVILAVGVANTASLAANGVTWYKARCLGSVAYVVARAVLS